MGRRALDMALDLLRGDAVPDVVTVPTELIIRRSRGCRPGVSGQVGVPVGGIGPAGEDQSAGGPERVAATAFRSPQPLPVPERRPVERGTFTVDSSRTTSTTVRAVLPDILHRPAAQPGD